MANKFITGLMLAMLCGLPGCRLMVTSAAEDLATNLSTAILNQTDPETVREGAPAYLLLVDGLIAADPESQNMLLSAAKLNNAYATVFVDDAKRAQVMADKSWEYARKALCVSFADDCEVYRRPYAEYVNFIDSASAADVPVLFAFGVSWLSWIQAHSDDWVARADLPKVEATFKRVVELDNTYQHGEPQMYLGVLSVLLPPALGGKPEQAKAYFEQAIALSDGRNLMFKVVFAERYARLLFDRELHDRLLTEVIQADAVQPELTLINIIAKQKAQQLLESADEYF